MILELREGDGTKEREWGEKVLDGREIGEVGASGNFSAGLSLSKQRQ